MYSTPYFVIYVDLVAADPHTGSYDIITHTDGRRGGGVGLSPIFVRFSARHV